MKLSVIIPAHNEGKTIREVISKVQNQDIGEWEKEIIFVDDGSTDDTAEEMEFFGYAIKTVRREENLGKGSAIRAGCKMATGEAVIIQDADLEYDPADFPALLAELKDPAVAAVFGSRNMRARRRGYSRYILGAKILTALLNLLYDTKLTDIYTCYKLVRTDCLKELDLKSDGFEVEAEITAKIIKKGYIIKEIPIDYHPRKFQDGKKIRFWDGLTGMWMIIKTRFEG